MNLEPKNGWSDPSDESFRELDDTLQDGPAPASVPDAAKPWLAEQRLMHGLLRALHTADAAAREGRIAGVMERIDADAAPARRWFHVAAAALLLGIVGVFFLLPSRLPTAEAAMDRAVAELAREVDRRFAIEHVVTAANGNAMTTQFSLVTRPGGSFRVTGKIALGPIQSNEITLGSDGSTLWMQSANGMLQREVPVAERERLLRGFDFLDLGYLDIHSLVRRLPDDCDVRVVERARGADGRSTLQLEATRKANVRVATRAMHLWCDEASGMVTRLEADTEDKRGNTRRFRVAYVGEEPSGSIDYSRPW